MIEQEAKSLIKIRNCFFWKWHACNYFLMVLFSFFLYINLLFLKDKWFKNFLEVALAYLNVHATVTISSRKVGG